MSTSSTTFKPTFYPGAAPSFTGGFDKTGGATGFGGFGGAVGECPVTGFTGYPTGYPTSFPSGSFGGYPAEWSRFAGFGAGYPGFTGGFTGFGGYPTEWSRFGGYPAEWSRFGGYPAEWSRFGAGYPASSSWTGYPWANNWSGNNNWWNNEWSSGSWDRSFFNDFERSIKCVERELDSLRKIFDFSTKTGGAKALSGKNFSTSMVHLPSRPTSSAEYYTFQNPVKYDWEGNRWLSLAFDLPSFKPEEVKVTLYSKANPAYIEVIATHDVKDTKEHTVKRTYERKYFFPADLYLKAEEIAKLEIKSYFTTEGTLYVEAMLPKLSAELAAKERGSRFSLFDFPFFTTPVKCEKKDI